MAVTEQDVIDNAALFAGIINGASDIDIGDLPVTTSMAGTDPLHIQEGGVDSKISKDAFEALLDEEMSTGFKNLVIDGDFNHNQMGGTTETGSVYIMDMWLQNKSTGAFSSTITPEYDSDISKNKIVYTLTASDLFLQQRIKDVSIANGKKISFFCEVSSTAGINNLSARLVQNFGSGGSSTLVTASSDSSNVPALSDKVWYRFDVDVPTIEGKTIGAGNYFRQAFYTTGAQTTDITFHRVRCIEAPENLPDNVIPEWVKQGEDPLETLPMVQAYYTKNNEGFLSLNNYGSFVGNDTTYAYGNIYFQSEMVQTPTVVLYDNTATANTVYKLGTGTIAATVSADLLNTKGFCRISKSGGMILGGKYLFGYTADARY